MDFSRKRNFVWLAVLLFCVGCTAAKDRHSLKGKNVLFIVADDLNCSLGCYGDPNAVTPHLDNLAESGVRFEQAHCQYPLCGPSRTSFLTGLYPGQSGVRDNRVLLRDALPEVTTLPQLFRQHGYDVVRVGKLFHYDNPGEIGTSGQDDNPSWDETYNPVGRDKREEHRIHSLVEGKFGGTLSWLSPSATMKSTQMAKWRKSHQENWRNLHRGQTIFLGRGLFSTSHTLCRAEQVFRLASFV